MGNEINVKLVFDFNPEKFIEEVFSKSELVSFLTFLTNGQNGIYRAKRNNYKCDGEYFVLVDNRDKEYEFDRKACIDTVKKAIASNK